MSHNVATLNVKISPTWTILRKISKSINFLITHTTDSPVHFSYDSDSYSATDITTVMLSLKQKEGLLDEQRPRMEREGMCFSFKGTAFPHVFSCSHGWLLLWMAFVFILIAHSNFSVESQLDRTEEAKPKTLCLTSSALSAGGVHL